MAKKLVSFETKDLIIEIDHSLCISCGTCAALAPKTFELDKNLLSQVKTDSDDSTQTIIGAAQSCAVGAITVTDKKTGKKLN